MTAVAHPVWAPSRVVPEGDFDKGKQRAVRVAQRPHQSPRLVRDIEVPADLQGVTAFEQDTQR